MKKSRAIPLKAKAKFVSKGPRDAIFQLNDDCLAEVLSFLPLSDVKTIVESDKRFRPAAKIRFGLGGVDVIDPEFLQTYPKDIQEDIYQNYGKRAKQMKFKLLPESEFLRAISHFGALTELILSEVELTPTMEHELPKGLTSLEIDRCVISDVVLQRWCVELNGTLADLRIIHRPSNDPEKPQTSYVGLKELHNITALLIDGDLDDAVVAPLIGQNKEHLQSLTLINGQRISRYTPIANAVWDNITALRKLKVLHLDQREFEGGVPSGLFPELTLLQIQVYCRLFVAIMDALACDSTLQSLIIDDQVTFDVSTLKRFRNLKHLEFLYWDWSQGMEGLYGLSQVETLIFNSNVFDRATDIKDLAKAMAMGNLRKLLVYGAFFFVDRRTDEETTEKKVKRAMRRWAKHIEFDITVQNP